MYVSRNLRKTNIAEYLLYMWQVEDLLRANGLDVDRIAENVVAKYQLDEAQQNELTEWYANLIEMMKHERLEKEGHLQINRNVLIELNDLHAQLIHSNKFPYYQSAYYKVLPYIVELRAKGDNRIDGPLLQRQFLRDDRQLISTWNANQNDVFLISAKADERIHRALDELLGQEAVESAHNDANLQALRNQHSIDFFHRIHLSFYKDGANYTNFSSICL